MAVNLQAPPFNLNAEGVEWVSQTLSALSVDEKVGQLFCLTDATTNPDALTAQISTWQPGAFMFRSAPADEIRTAVSTIQQAATVPLLLPANLEMGGSGLAAEGTFFASELAVAATSDPEQARRLGYICAQEAAACGGNWSFAPIVDIDYSWRNPITNERTFGSDPDTVLAMGSAYCRGVADSGRDIAVCIKHFPGDGCDERDQHLLSTVNSLSAEDWWASYGRVYQALIDQGVETLMVGHILQPALERDANPSVREQDMLPASMSRALVQGVLRERMGFNGLITTDATPMVGYNMMLPRAEALVTSINAGVDMLLFCKNCSEDFGAIRAAAADGRISTERLDDAVTRILATKAHLKLHLRRACGTYLPDKSALASLGSAEHRAWATECANKAITLVKDNQQLLPISPECTPRVRLTVLGEGASGSFGEGASISNVLAKALRREGFEVALYDAATLEHGEIFTAGVQDLKQKFDLSIVAANVATGSNNTTRRLNWITLMAANEPWYTHDIPTMFISFANPYHMVDVPFISTFINCYCSNQESVDACVQKLVGKSEFMGENPVDPWCGGVFGARWM